MQASPATSGTHTACKIQFFYFLQAKPEEQRVIYNLWIASPSAHNDNFFAYNDVTGGVAQHHQLKEPTI